MALKLFSFFFFSFLFLKNKKITRKEEKRAFSKKKPEQIDILNKNWGYFRRGGCSSRESRVGGRHLTVMGRDGSNGHPAPVIFFLFFYYFRLLSRKKMNKSLSSEWKYSIILFLFFRLWTCDRVNTLPESKRKKKQDFFFGTLVTTTTFPGKEK